MTSWEWVCLDFRGLGIKMSERIKIITSLHTECARQHDLHAQKNLKTHEVDEHAVIRKYEGSAPIIAIFCNSTNLPKELKVHLLKSSFLP